MRKLLLGMSVCTDRFNPATSSVSVCPKGPFLLEEPKLAAGKNPRWPVRYRCPLRRFASVTSISLRFWPTCPGIARSRSDSFNCSDWASARCSWAFRNSVIEV